MTPFNLQSGKRISLSACFSLLCLTLFARSQNFVQATDIYDLDRIVVVAHRSEVPLHQVGSSVDILEAKDLQKSDQPFLLDSLRFVPGFYLRNNGSPGGVFGITTRGLNANPPTVLIDGIKVDNPADGQIINFGSLFGNNVSRVEILKGPQSSLYGANALSGVISIHTTDGRSEPESKVGLSYGSHDTIAGNISTQGAQEKLSWALNLNYYEHAFSVQDKSFGPEWADDDKYENLQTTLKLGYDISDTTSLHFLTYWFDTSSAFDPGLPDSLFGDPEFENVTETTQLFSRVGADFEVSDTWNSTVGMAFTDVESVTVTGGRFPSNGDRLRYDWKNEIGLTEQWKLVAGAEYETEDNRTEDVTRDNTSIFVENIFPVSNAFTWTLGGRYDDNSAYGEETTWRSTFSYSIKDSETRFRGSYGTSFQAPSFYQLFSAFGSEGLTPESGEGWDLGFEQALADGKLYFTTTLFGNEVEDKIIFSFDSFTFANEELYESEGLETVLKFQVAQNATASIAHTYSDANHLDGTEAERVPRNIISFNVDWQPSEKTNISVNVLKVSSQYSLRTSTSKQEGYAVANLASQYDLNDRTQLWLRIDNLFDEEYEEVLSFQTSGFAVFGGARFSF